MSDGIVLSAALRSNLLSLQNTQKSIDKTQLNLATGKKVNSALDNPQSFFASQALTNRASDLTRLLDGIGQSIQVIKAADNGVSALTKLVEQADSIATSAQDAIASSSQVAKVTGNVNLKGVNDLTTIAGYPAGTTLTFSIIDPDTGSRLATLDSFGAASTGTTEAIAITANTSTDDLITAINSLVDTRSSAQVLKASLDPAGNLQIESLNGGAFTVNFTTTANTDVPNQAAASALGFGNIAKLNQNGASGTNTVGFTASNTAVLTSKALYTSANTLANASSTIGGLFASNGSTVRTTAFVNNDTLTINVGGKTSANLLSAAAATQTIQGVVDLINNDSNIGDLVEASYDSSTGQISLRAIDASVEDVKISLTTQSGAAKTFDLFGTSGLTTGAVAGNAATETIRLGAAAGQLASFEQQFNGIREQISQLVSNGDTGYRGTNLLNGDNLTTSFNEDRSSTLTTEGVDFTAEGLEIEEAIFSSSASIAETLGEVRDALAQIRNFGSSLASDLSVIQTREDFTASLINTLTEGSDKLTLADQNAEGAKLLSLQTRQSLGVTSLSLASQSQQAILRLF